MQAKKEKSPNFLRLNLGCGSNKIAGYVNIDVEPACKPDRVCNFVAEALPYKNSSVDEIVLFHTIEHIVKPHHRRLLLDFHRVLKSGGLLIISYPEFTKCVENWKTNYRGKKDFWEHTIFGRQAYPSDFHVSLMYTPDFKRELKNAGFIGVHDIPEVAEPHNTIIMGRKGLKLVSYDDLIADDMRKMRLVKS